MNEIVPKVIYNPFGSIVKVFLQLLYYTIICLEWRKVVHRSNQHSPRQRCGLTMRELADELGYKSHGFMAISKAGASIRHWSWPWRSRIISVYRWISWRGMSWRLSEKIFTRCDLTSAWVIRAVAEGVCAARRTQEEPELKDALLANLGGHTLPSQWVAVRTLSDHVIAGSTCYSYLRSQCSLRRCSHWFLVFHAYQLGQYAILFHSDTSVSNIITVLNISLLIW